MRFRVDESISKNSPSEPEVPCRRRVGWKSDQQMDMIRNPSGCEHRNAMIPADTGEVFGKAREQFVWYEVLASFGAGY
jgi:hypothetical protein